MTQTFHNITSQNWTSKI